jgi:hypothetical protein
VAQASEGAEKGPKYMAADERKINADGKRMAYPKFISVHRRLTIVIPGVFQPSVSACVKYMTPIAILAI